jgi:hypothetical protein
MKRSLLAVLATLALVLGVSASASAATASPNASCAGLAGASRAGAPGAQAEVVLRVVTEAHLGGFSPGAVEFSGFAHFHDQSVEVCLD